MANLQDRLRTLGEAICQHELGGDRFPIFLAIVGDAAQRIADLEEALRPFGEAAKRSEKSDAYHKIQRADDEDVGIVVHASALREALTIST